MAQTLKGIQKIEVKEMNRKGSQLKKKQKNYECNFHHHYGLCQVAYMFIFFYRSWPLVFQFNSITNVPQCADLDHLE